LREARNPLTAIDVHWWIYCVEVGASISLDRRIIGKAIDAMFDFDFASAQLFATIASEAALNRFRRSVPNVRTHPATLDPKLREAIRWCHEYFPQAESSFADLQDDVRVRLKEPRDEFGHGESSPTETLVDGYQAVQTSVELLTAVEQTIQSWLARESR
jgi:hypothetical protein